MRIAVTGTTGQIVRCLIERGGRAGHEVIALGRPQLDLTEPGTVLGAIKAASPDVVVSAAAYTAVDRAESERDLAFAINCRGAAVVAEASRDLGVPLVHLSTDYVFDGQLDRPYRETDPTGPSGVYGASKLAGEQAVFAANENAAVLRVAWVYSPFGGNFVKTMLRLARDRDRISVVADQIGNPTSAFDIADGVVSVAQNLVADRNPALRGIFHMTADGETSWAGFARAIFDASRLHGGPWAEVVPIGAADYPAAAIRPANSRLDCRLIAETHGVCLPNWRDALEIVISRLQTPGHEAHQGKGTDR